MLKFIAMALSFATLCAAEVCNGELTFVFDRSSSTGTNFQDKMVPFAKRMVEHFRSPAIKTSLVWFGLEGHLALELTNDMEIVLDTLDSMAVGVHSPAIGAQGTNIAAGLALVVPEDLSKQRVVFLVSDGCSPDFEAQSEEEARRLREQNFEVYVIFVPGQSELIQCPLFLESLASPPLQSHFLHVDGYQTLDTQAFVQELLQTSCFGVVDVSPPDGEEPCVSNRQKLTVQGRGFAQSNDFSNFNCKFSLACSEPDCPDPMASCLDQAGVQCALLSLDGSARHACGSPYMMYNCPRTCQTCGLAPALVHNDTLLTCQAPQLTHGSYEVALTRNGQTFTNGVPLAPNHCDPPIMPPYEPLAALDVRVLLAPKLSKSQTAGFSLLITNVGEVAVAGPLAVSGRSEAGSWAVTCENVLVLAVDEAMACFGSKVLSAADVESGTFSVRVVAVGTTRMGVVQATKMIWIESETTTLPPSTRRPTSRPTALPTKQPNVVLVPFPTPLPTALPTALPTELPTQFPTSQQEQHTAEPSPRPSAEPTHEREPSLTPMPTPVQGDGGNASGNGTATPDEWMPPPAFNVSGSGVSPGDACASWLSRPVLSALPTHLACVPWWVWAIVGGVLLLSVLLCCLCCCHRKQEELLPAPEPYKPVPSPPLPEGYKYRRGSASQDQLVEIHRGLPAPRIPPRAPPFPQPTLGREPYQHIAFEEGPAPHTAVEEGPPEDPTVVHLRFSDATL